MYMGLLSLILLVIGYKIYGRKAEKIFGINIHRAPLAAADSENTPLNYRLAQLAQFGITSGIDCLFGAVVGVVYGPFMMLWCVIGTTFMGAVLNYYCGMYAVSRQGQTLNRAVLQKYGKNLYGLSTLLFILFAALAVSVNYSFLININFYGFNFNVSTLWFVYLLMITGISMLPTQWFTRGYAVFAGVLLMATLAFIAGAFSQINNVNLSWNIKEYSELKFAYPVLMFVVCAGAVSGMQGLQSMLIAPSVKNEKMGKGIFFGAAVGQALFVIVWDLLILAYHPSFSALSSAVRKAATPYIILRETAQAALGSGGHILIFVLAGLLCISAGGTMLRFGRIILAETKIFGRSNDVISTVVILALSFCLYHYEIGSAYFTVFNQGLAVLLFLGLFSLLRQKGNSGKICLYPALVLAGAVVAYTMLVHAGQPILNSACVGLALTGILFALFLRKPKSR